MTLPVFSINPAISADTLQSELESRIDEAKAMTEVLAMVDLEWTTHDLIPYSVALHRKMEEISGLFKAMTDTDK